MKVIYFISPARGHVSMQHENIAFVAEDYPIYVTETLEHTVAYKRLHVFFPERVIR